MKKITILTLLLAIGIFFAPGTGSAVAANTWYMSITNSGDLVEGEWFALEIYFGNADNGDPDVANDGCHNLNLYFLDIAYNTDLMEYGNWTEYIDHFGEDPPGPPPAEQIWDGGLIPNQPTENPIGYVYDIMGTEPLGNNFVFYPDDGLDPSSTPTANLPYNLMARIWFIAKVSGHYDDFGIEWHAPDTDSYIKVDWVKYDVEQGHTFTTWKDGGVLKCSYEYPYVLHLGVNEYGVDSFPQELAGNAWYTGPAAAGQTLQWIYGEPYDLYTVDQAALYTAYHNGASGQDLNTADERTLIQTEKPVTSPSYAYNFAEEADDDEDMAIKRFIHWCDFNVQEYYPSATGINEPQVPSLIVTSSNDYGYQWKTLRGFATSVDPCDESSVFTIPDMEVHGLWLNDPAIGGLGYNVYLTGDEFKAVYEQVDGKYRSVCEPPEDVDEALLEESLQASEINYEEGKPNDELADALQLKDDLELSADISSKFKVDVEPVKVEPIDVAELFKKVNWDDIIPGMLMSSPDFRNIFSRSKFKETLKVTNLDSGLAYALILFTQTGSRQDDTASIVLLTDEDTGKFRQATWDNEKAVYLPVSEKEALKIAMQALGLENKLEADSKRPSLELLPVNKDSVRLVWSADYCLSQFLPMYEVTINGGIAYVLQDGSCIIVKKPSGPQTPVPVSPFR